MIHPLIRRLAAVVALALLCFVPLTTAVEHGTPTSLHGPTVTVCDDLFAWRSSGGNPWADWGAKKNGNGLVQSYYAQRGGNRASSNPTTVPVVDDDLKFAIQPTLDQIRVYGAHRVTRGEGVVVAVIDGGFNLNHPALVDRLHSAGYDAIDKDWDAHDVGNQYDDDGDGIADAAVGHGTFVAGQILEVAPYATILPIRARDDEGFGTNKELEDALYHAWMLGADVINVSGQTAIGRSRYITNLVSWFHRSGIVVVNSAGNDGLEGLSEIGDEGTSLVVGAVDADNRLAAWSNRPAEHGRTFMVAPGVDLYGPLGVHGSDDNWGFWSGTSFSTALVSGAAALVKAAHPWLDSASVIERLMRYSDPAYGEDGRYIGYGRLHVTRAVTR